MELTGVRRLCCAVRFMPQTVCIKPQLISTIRAYMPGQEVWERYGHNGASDQTTLNASLACHHPPKLNSLIGFHSILLWTVAAAAAATVNVAVTIIVILTVTPL